MGKYIYIIELEKGDDMVFFSLLIFLFLFTNFLLILIIRSLLLFIPSNLTFEHYEFNLTQYWILFFFLKERLHFFFLSFRLLSVSLILFFFFFLSSFVGLVIISHTTYSMSLLGFPFNGQHKLFYVVERSRKFSSSE